MPIMFSRGRNEAYGVFISEIISTPPDHFDNALQEKVYHALQTLDIPFQRVHTDEAITMEDCIQINQKLEMKMVKTLFLCNRQQTAFYLFITSASKPFRAKDISGALRVARLSFAPADLMETMLGTKVGAATVFSAILDSDHEVQIILDEDVASEPWYGCSDGTTTGYMKMRTAQIIHDFLPFTSHIPTIIQV